MANPTPLILAWQASPTSSDFGSLANDPLAPDATIEHALPVPSVGTSLDIFHGYIGVFIVAFLVTLVMTPIMRRLAIANGIVDRPSESRKIHRVPIAYLGGVAVFLGMLAAITFSYVAPDLVLGGKPVSILEPHQSRFEQLPVPISVVVGMFAIMFTGLLDDIAHLIPRSKIGGQLLAAAALSYQDIGTKVASGLLQPIGAFLGNQELVYRIPLPFEIPGYGSSLVIDLIYWSGVVIIALFVLGACNASNLIDGLDGLLSGVTAIASMGLLLIALWLAASDDGRLDSARVVLALALLGSCLGFLPHNFNPATIFLGDAGSLLMGYVTIVIVLMLGDTGRTHLVVAGLIIYSIPIIDTVLAMVRRKMAGKSLSSADDQHLHHMLKRALGVRGAVMTLYAAGIAFAALGIWLSMGRVRVVFTIAMVVWAFIGVTAVKVARRQALEAQGKALAEGGSPATVRPSVRKDPEPRKPSPAR
ncbi:MAG: undecaprenyl/decaprenyl-phosphate alpha-N-acetylglucosaminyl 1-phosphate transferase [Phycisphaerae bacterium]|nr:undecaprenyl/decaprenyl-phosphate alpha-N-acetylglucosaminyl 1-phosphate transferase [Phycisphaerae bacterium]